MFLTGTQRTRAAGWAKASTGQGSVPRDHRRPGGGRAMGFSQCDPVGEEPVGDVNAYSLQDDVSSRSKLPALSQQGRGCRMVAQSPGPLTLQNTEALALWWLPGPVWWRMARKPWKRKSTERTN